MKQRFIVISEDERHSQWLEQCLAPEYEAVIADEPSAERVAQLVDAASTSLIFVRVDTQDCRSRAKLIEDVLALKSGLDIVAISDQEEKDAILSAMRAGAQDFLQVGGDGADLRETVLRLGERSPGRDSGSSDRGKQVAILCARPDVSTSTFAVHLALRTRQTVPRDEDVLLIDLALPASDSLFFLDMEPSYTFIDAVRSVRRFDQTLIQTAFTRDPSGLAVLPLPEDPSAMQDVASNDMLALFAVLKNYFQHTVLNLGGLRSPEFVYQALKQSDRIMLLADQSVASCKAARRLVEGITERGVPIETIDLIVDRYSNKIEPSAEKIAEVIGVKLGFTLPPNGFMMLQAMNCAQSIFETAPDSGYARGIRNLCSQMLDLGEAEQEHSGLGAALGAFARRLGLSG